MYAGSINVPGLYRVCSFIYGSHVHAHRHTHGTRVCVYSAPAPLLSCFPAALQRSTCGSRTRARFIAPAVSRKRVRCTAIDRGKVRERQREREGQRAFLVPHFVVALSGSNSFTISLLFCSYIQRLNGESAQSAGRQSFDAKSSVELIVGLNNRRVHE